MCSCPARTTGPWASRHLGVLRRICGPLRYRRTARDQRSRGNDDCRQKDGSPDLFHFTTSRSFTFLFDPVIDCLQFYHTSETKESALPLGSATRPRSPAHPVDRAGRLLDDQVPAALLGVEEHGEYRKGPEHDLLPVDVQGDRVEPVLDDDDEQRAKKGPAERSPSRPSAACLPAPPPQSTTGSADRLSWPGWFSARSNRMRRPGRSRSLTGHRPRTWWSSPSGRTSSRPVRWRRPRKRICPSAVFD